MSRRKRPVALIKCTAARETVNAIAETSGLTAEPAGKPDHFYLLNTGRNKASELEPDLLEVVASKLDGAVRQGIIPRWARVDNGSRVRRIARSGTCDS